jgi:hypothetical protein
MHRLVYTTCHAVGKLAGWRPIPGHRVSNMVDFTDEGDGSTEDTSPGESRPRVAAEIAASSATSPQPTVLAHDWRTLRTRADRADKTNVLPVESATVR